MQVSSGFGFPIIETLNMWLPTHLQCVCVCGWGGGGGGGGGIHCAMAKQSKAQGCFSLLYSCLLKRDVFIYLSNEVTTVVCLGTPKVMQKYTLATFCGTVGDATVMNQFGFFQLPDPFFWQISGLSLYK